MQLSFCFCCSLSIVCSLPNTHQQQQQHLWASSRSTASCATSRRQKLLRLPPKLPHLRNRSQATGPSSSHASTLGSSSSSTRHTSSRSGRQHQPVDSNFVLHATLPHTLAPLYLPFFACLPACSSANHCQQLLAQQLGWRAPPSLNTWHAAQQQQLSTVCLRAAAAPTQTGRFRISSSTSPISCLDLQQLNPSALVAVGESHGRLHVCRLSRLQAASASALSAAAALPPDVREALLDPIRWARHALAADGMPPGAGSIPTAAAGAGVLSFDTQQQLRSCCWLQQQHNGSTAASSSEGVLVTSAPGGIMKRVITEVIEVGGGLSLVVFLSRPIAWPIQRSRRHTLFL